MILIISCLRTAEDNSNRNYSEIMTTAGQVVRSFLLSNAHVQAKAVRTPTCIHSFTVTIKINYNELEKILLLVIQYNKHLRTRNSKLMHSYFSLGIHHLRMPEN